MPVTSNRETCCEFWNKRSMLTRIALKLLEMTAWMPLPWLRGFGVAAGSNALFCRAIAGDVWFRPICACAFRIGRRSECIALQSKLLFILPSPGWTGAGCGTARLKRSAGDCSLTGALRELEGDTPTVIFAPHFMGLDAGWTALTQQVPRHSPPFTPTRPTRRRMPGFARAASVLAMPSFLVVLMASSPFVPALKAGRAAVPVAGHEFWAGRVGVCAVLRCACGHRAIACHVLRRLGRAKVVPVITRMTPQGYDVEVLPAWNNFPSGDPVADTARMNLRAAELH